MKALNLYFYDFRIPPHFQLCIPPIPPPPPSASLSALLHPCAYLLISSTAPSHAPSSTGLHYFFLHFASPSLSASLPQHRLVTFFCSILSITILSSASFSHSLHFPLLQHRLFTFLYSILSIIIPSSASFSHPSHLPVYFFSNTSPPSTVPHLIHHLFSPFLLH